MALDADPQVNAEVCCVCGSTDVGYRNYQDKPFCWPCADGNTPQPQVDAVLACLPVRDDGMVSIGEVDQGGRMWTTLVRARPLAARIAARVIRSLAEPHPTGSAIQVETLRHVADDLEEGAT